MQSRSGDLQRDFARECAAAKVRILPPAEAEAIADAALVRQERGERNQDRVRAGQKLGDIPGATNMVLDALAQRGRARP
jgi:hypothetical protein